MQRHLVLIVFAMTAAVATPSKSQTDLSAFEGSNPNREAQGTQCNLAIKTGLPAYLPFCGTVITVELGGSEFKNFYEGDGINPFLTHSQAVQFASQVDRVEKIRGASLPCKGKSLDNCIARLSSNMFVTSNPFEPEWVPGDPVLETSYVNLLAYKPPVYDELRRSEFQSERQVKVTIGVGEGEVVSSISIDQRWRRPSLTNVMKTGFPEALSVLGNECGAGKQGSIAAINAILAIPREATDMGQFGQKTMTICGQVVSATSFEAERNPLDDQEILISVRAKL